MNSEEFCLLDIPKVYQTKRLILKVPEPGDGPMMRNAMKGSLSQLQKWLPWAKPAPTVRDAELFARQAAADFLNRKVFHYSIFLQKPRVMIGGVAVNEVDLTTMAVDLGYWLNRKYQGHSYMTEAVGYLTDRIRDDWKMRRFVIRCDLRNSASAMVAVSLNFNCEGLFRGDALDMDGKPCNTLQFAKVF